MKCTFDILQGKAKDKFRKNPRKDLFNNIIEVTTNGDFEVVLHLKRPQPSLLAMLASGYTPIYPCHVSPAQMRTHPIGTGPFKFVDFKQNESITLAKNPDYWKKGMVPALTDLPEGCVFAPRCAFAEERCRQTYPAYEEKRPRHWAACWRSAELFGGRDG